jgi:hypothetical protein
MFLPSFDVFVHNFDTVTDQDITTPTIFMLFYTNFVFYELCKSYRIPKLKA